jgi:hypothetical protein
MSKRFEEARPTTARRGIPRGGLEGQKPGRCEHRPQPELIGASQFDESAIEHPLQGLRQLGLSLALPRGPSFDQEAFAEPPDLAEPRIKLHADGLALVWSEARFLDRVGGVRSFAF